MTPTVRLLFFTAEPWPTFRADVAVLFGKELPQRGVFADLVTAAAEGGESAKWGGGIARLCTAKGSRLYRRLVTLKHRLRVLMSASPEDYSAIQVRDLPIFSALAYVAAHWKGLKFYYWMSYPIPEGQILLARERGLSAGSARWAYNIIFGVFGRWLLYRHVLRRADHVFAQSDRMVEDLSALGIDRYKITAVPMGVDWPEISRFTSLPPAADRRLSGRRVLLYLGAQVRPRRIEVLFEMLAIVRRSVPEAMLVLVGDVDDVSHREWLRAKAFAAGVSEHVLWTDWLPMAEAWRYVRAAEVGLSPFPRSYILDSASPTKVLEYLALGVPVVCNDNPDQANVIRQSGGGLCVHYTAQTFADAVQTLLSEEPPRRQQRIESGKAFVLQHRNYKELGWNLASCYKVLHAPPSKRARGRGEKHGAKTIDS